MLRYAIRLPSAFFETVATSLTVYFCALDAAPFLKAPATETQRSTLASPGLRK
jgi:hypothetical protein